MGDKQKDTDSFILVRQAMSSLSTNREPSLVTTLDLQANQKKKKKQLWVLLHIKISILRCKLPRLNECCCYIGGTTVG